MKKQRAMALILSAIMAIGTLPTNVLAVSESTLPVDNAPAAEVIDNTAVIDNEISAVDEVVVSDAAVTTDEDEYAAMADWKSGWTGTGKGSYTVKPSGNNVNLKITKSGTGKVSSGEDSFAYYVSEVPTDNDFTMTAKITVNNLNTLGSSNPQQSSFGLVAMDELYKVVDPAPKFTNTIMLMSYMAKSTDTSAALYATTRNGATREIHDQMSESYSSKGSNFATYDVSIIKAGASYVINCDNNSYSLSDATIFKDQLYVGFFVARDAEITVSDINLSVDEKVVTALSIESMPNKTDFALNEDMDLTGLKLVASYTDGTQGEVTDYVVTGFDTATKGSKEMTLSKGFYSVKIPYTVSALKCTGITVNYAPVKNEYFIGSRFNDTGIELTASYANGTTAKLAEGEYELYLDGKLIDNTTYLTKENVGTKTVVVKHKESESIDPANGTGTFNIEVEDYTFSGIGIMGLTGQTSFYVGDTFTSTGLLVKGIYTDNAGNRKTDVLAEDEYTVADVDISIPGIIPVKVTSVVNPNFTTSYNVTVIEKTPTKFAIKEYPRMTFDIGEDFDPKGMVMAIQQSNGELEPTDEYTINTVDYDNTVEGVTKVYIVPNDPSYQAITLNVTIEESNTHHWGKAIFGQSTSTSKCKIDTENKEFVRIYSTGGAGKITGDHDGIAYYYTRVNADNNFVISGDILVNDYLQHDNDDTRRNGQEAFGIMARDVIPLKGKEGGIVVSAEEAEINKENGEPVPSNSGSVFASNIALLGGYSGTGWPTDPTSISYEKNTQINRINLYMRTGVTEIDGGGVKNGPYKLSDTFPARGNRYHVTLKKINGGMYAKCYDYQTGKTKETYQYLDEFLNIQNEDTIYVGFFTARYADISVSNIEVYETDPATDPITSVMEEETVIPTLSVTSSLYTNMINYSLVIKPSNKFGGLVTIKNGDKVLYANEAIGKKASSFTIELYPDTINELTILYSPNKGDNITSTDDILSRVSVTQRTKVNNESVIYAAPNGTIDGEGTINSPMDIRTAIGFLKRGQKIIALEGNYLMTGEITIPESSAGRENEMKYLFAEEGKEVTFDMQKLYPGTVLEGDYWHIKGIDFINSADNQKPFHLAASNCIIEDCKFYNNGDTGFQISRNSTDYNSIDEWPSNNLILNCESFNNVDPSMINADGFGAKLTVGVGNVFKNCISHHNVDDGWDCYTKLASGPIGAVTLDNCVSYRQGYRLNEDGSETAYGAGGHNGYKMGGENIPVQHYLKNCLAFENGANGITSNSNPQMKIRNMISYKNSGANYSLKTSSSGVYKHNYDLMDCISYSGGSDSISTYTYNTNYTNGSDVYIGNDTNYWNGKNESGDKINEKFFKSIKKSDSLVNGRYLQDEDGNFILGDFLARADGYVYVEPETEATTEATTEVTTKAPSNNGGGSKGAGVNSHASLVVETASKTTTEADTEETTDTADETTEATTESSKDVLFNDISGNFAEEYIISLAEAGIVNGVGDGRFAPNAKVTRADFAVMLVGAMKYDNAKEDVITFADVTKNDYFYNAVNTAYAMNIIKGISDNEFAPRAEITRQDVMVIVDRALSLEDNDAYTLDNYNDANTISAYAYDSVKRLVGAGVISGNNGNINPKASLTRAEAAVIIGKILEK